MIIVTKKITDVCLFQNLVPEKSKDLIFDGPVGHHQTAISLLKRHLPEPLSVQDKLSIASRQTIASQ